VYPRQERGDLPRLIESHLPANRYQDFYSKTLSLYRSSTALGRATNASMRTDFNLITHKKQIIMASKNAYVQAYWIHRHRGYAARLDIYLSM